MSRNLLVRFSNVRLPFSPQKLSKSSDMRILKNFCSKALISLSFFALFACKSEFFVEAYVSDAFLEENINTPASMRVEIPSCSSQSEYERKVISLFDSTSNAKIVGCEEEGMESYMVVSLDAEMATENSKRDLILFRESFGDLEIDGKFYEVVALKPVISGDFLQRVNSLMEENLQTLSYENVKFEIALNNDEREDAIITAYNLWVDGEPFQNYRRQPLKRRGKITLTFSNLVSDLILRNKMPIVTFVGRSK